MDHEAIIVIVERGKANAVVKKAVEAGAGGATVVYGRGSGSEVLSFFSSLKVEPAKELILIITTKDKLRDLFIVVAEAARVNEKGKGIAFTVPIGNLCGMSPIIPGAEDGISP